MPVEDWKLSLDSFRNRIKKLRKGVPVETAQFNDPLAEEVEWTPLAPGGASFKTNTLSKINVYRYEFKASVGALIFYWTFIIVGLGVAIGAFFAGDPGEVERNSPAIGPLIFGAIFSAVGVLMLTSQSKPITFDKGQGLFWRGKNPPTSMRINHEKKPQWANLPDIHALQIIKEYCRGSNRSRGYYSYELNLVLNDGSRIHVIDHGKYGHLKRDAEILAEFLNVPLWNGS